MINRLIFSDPADQFQALQFNFKSLFFHCNRYFPNSPTCTNFALSYEIVENLYKQILLVNMHNSTRVNERHH